MGLPQRQVFFYLAEVAILTGHKTQLLHHHNLPVRRVKQFGTDISRILGECVLITSLPGWASRTHVESLGKPRLIKLISISKDTHLVFSIYQAFFGFLKKHDDI